MAGKSPTEDSRQPDAIASKHRRSFVGSGRTRVGGQPNLPKAIGAMFRSAREVQHLSQDQLADLTDGAPGGPVSRTTISSIERGRSMPGVDTLLSLTSVLYIEPMEVLERINLATKVPVDLTGFSLEDLSRKAEEHFWAGDYRMALATYDAMFERFALDPPKDLAERARVHARIEINRAVAMRRCGALNAARSAAERAIERTEAIPTLRAEAYMVLASALGQMGSFALAEDATERAVQLAAAGDAILQGRAWNQKGSVLHRARKFKEARDALLTARQMLAKTRDYYHRIRIEGNIGECLMDLGQTKQARTRFTRAIELARKYGDPACEASWLVELGRLALQSEQLDEAGQCALAALRIAKPAEQLLTIFRAEWLQHLIARACNPKEPDRRRLGFLRKLYVRLKEHQGLDVIREFKEQVLDASRAQEQSP